MIRSEGKLKQTSVKGEYHLNSLWLCGQQKPVRRPIVEVPCYNMKKSWIPLISVLSIAVVAAVAFVVIAMQKGKYFVFLFHFNRE